MASSSEPYGDDPPAPIRMRRLIVPIYVPAFLAALAQKLVIAVLPLYIKNDLGGDDSAIGTIMSMQGLGAFTTAAVAGYVIALVGDRCGMIGGSVVACTAYFACFLIAMLPVMDSSMALLACSYFGTGIGKSSFEVARNSYMAFNVPKALRGRANGLIGGCARVASMLGPALGGVAVHAFGADAAAFLIQSGVGLMAVAVLVVGLPPAATASSTPLQQDVAPVNEPSLAHGKNERSPCASACTSASPRSTSEHACATHSTSISSRLRRTWSTTILVPLLAAGPTGFSFGFVRAARSLLIPLKADAIDLPVSAVGYVTAASFACDTLLFPLGGHISDRCGRKAAGVPSLLIMSAGCLLLMVADTVWGVTLASALVGVGNALSSGIVQTVGQDAAPAAPKPRSQFLGLYKVATDCGTFLGPLAVGLVSDAAGLDAAAAVIAAVTCGCALWYAFMSKESRPGPRAGHCTVSGTTHEFTHPRKDMAKKAKHRGHGRDHGAEQDGGAHGMADGLMEVPPTDLAASALGMYSEVESMAISSSSKSRARSERA